ncbi:hypothetical protein [uncultured Draconibacterium sp.]|uniref:hypothetical protein n=1 Tax=uncultured Draconibacterium sp. TaxID=1573823 RepID=UPI0029C876E7|nr:hypothetical protein [uncultured Draconibacterium sp.]
MKKFLPNQILTRTLLLGLVFLFLGLSESFGQTITLDGNLNPYDEYASGATQLYDPTIGSTCAVDQVWASFDIPDETIYLLFNVGNGGSAIFRLYFDIDGNSTTGLIVDTEITDNNGEYVNAYGADRVIEVNSGKANQITYYSYTTQTDGSVLREEIPHSIEGKSGFIYDEFGNQIGNSMEFAIPFSDFDYQPCDNIGEFINVGSYAAVKGGNINADFCNAVPLDFEIGAGGNISPELETICPGTTSPEMVLSGEQGTIVGWQQRLVNGPEFEDYNPLTQNVIPDTEGDHTYQIVLFESTEFRAVIQIGAELCEGEVAYLYSSSATITVAPQPNIEVQDLTECENSVGGNQAQFDLTSAVTWDIGTPAYSSNGTTITSPENYTGTDNEVITFTVTSDDECVTTETFTLQVDPKPSCSITGDLSICPSSTGNIYSGSDEDGMTYSWSISGGATINGSSTGQTVLVDANGICGGSFILELTTTKNGCSSTCSIEVVVQDTTPPAIVETAMEDLTVECADDWSAELAAWLENNAGATASDLCGEVTWSNNYDTQTLTDECGATGQLTVTFTATDECDNTSTTTAVFKIEDTTPPAIVETAMEDLTVECADDWSAELAAWLENNAGATASDLCGEVTWSNNYDTQTLTDECGATGQLTVTFTATDECDNTSTTTAVFKIEDTTPPAIVETAMEDLTVECADDWSAELAAWLENNAGATASDLCGEVTWSNNYDTQTLTDECGATGQLTVTFTATDECDNTSTTTAVFKIEDTTPPAIVETAMEDLTVECADDWSAELAAWLENNAGATASDLCGEVTWSNNYDTQTLTDECGATGQLTVTFTATDECDNTSTTTAVFKIEDTTPPAIVETAMEDLTVECADDWSAELAAWLENNAGATASDLCGEVTWSNNYDTQTLTDECGATGQLTVTFTATDECDNTSTTTAVFKIEDTTPPAIVETAMEDLTVECADDWSAELAAWLENNAGATASDLCGEVTWSNNYDTQTLTDECGATGQLTVTFTATDECDNTSTTTAVFKIEDTTPPAIVETAMEDLTVECADDWSAELAAWLENNAGATASDLCGEVTWSNNYDTQTLTDECGATGQLTVTFTATDECDNTSTTTAVFKIEDTTPPAIVETAMEDLTVECADDWSAELAAWLENNAGATASDLCGEVTWSNNYDTQTLTDECGATGQLTVTFTATDECDNTSTTTAVFKIEDTTPPAIVETAMEDLTVECADDWSAELAAWLENNAGATASDLCGEVTWSNNYDTQTLTDECGATGQLTVTFTATDECDNTSTTTAVFKIEDTTPPAIVETAMEDLTVECADDWSAELAAWLENNAGATASDLCGEVTWSNNYDTQTLTDECGATGQLTVTFTATDECDNTSTTTAVFKIEDTTDPTIDNTNLTNINIECGIDPANKLSDWLANHAGATATDNCGDVTWSNNYGEDENIQCDGGAITVIFTATDACGNESTTSASYSIQDNTAPAFNETLPQAETTAECDDVAEAVVLTAADNCDIDVPVVFTETRTDGDCANSYTLTRTWTATDDCDNETSFTQTVIVSDNTAPTFNETLPTAEITAECDNVVEAVVLTAADNCDTDVPVVFTEIRTDGDCANSYTLTRTWKATDDCGNETSHTQTVIVSDNTAPTFNETLPTAEITAECDNVVEPDVLTAADNCDTDVPVVFTETRTDGDCANSYTLTRTWKATDDCGNETSFTQTVIVSDNTAPTFNETLPTAEITAECDNVVEAVVLTAADNCDTDVPVVFTETRTDGDCANSYTLTRTWTATDDCGNETSFTQTVIVSDNTAPTFNETLPTAEITAECDNVVEAVVLTAADNCDTDVPVVFTETRTDGDCANSYTLTRTWTATDDCGNETSHTQTVTVSDNTAPTFNETLPTAEITTECDNVVEADVLTAADNCDTDVPVVFTETRTDGDCANSYTLTRTWTATDDCGNETSFTQTVTVSDNTAPAFNETLPTAEITAECDNVVEAVVLTAADNCDTDVPVVFTETRTDGDCANSYTLTRTWTATDDCGNETSHTQTVTVSDNTAPTFNETLPTAEITAECDNFVEAVVLTAADNCDTDVQVVFTETRTDGDCANSYTLTRTWTATDDCDNESSFTQTVIVSDNTAPTFNETLPTAEITAECDNVVEAIVLTAADNCDSDVPVVFTETKTDGDCANSYTLTRTWTATDDCGNATSGSCCADCY